MPPALDKQHLTALVQEILQGKGDDQQIAAWRKRLDRSVPCPAGYVFDLILSPHVCGLGQTPTAHEIAQKALSYTPIQLSWAAALASPGDCGQSDGPTPHARIPTSPA